MRIDSQGLFWHDVQVKRKQGQRSYQIQAIPDTGWRPPSYYPNLSSESILSIDTETYDPDIEDHGPGWARDPENFYVCGFSIGTLDGHRWYFPTRHQVQKEYNLNPEHAFRWLSDVTRQRTRTYIGANLIYDVGGLRHEGIRLDIDKNGNRNELLDVQYGEALLEERARVALEILGRKYIGHGKTKEELFEWSAKSYGGKPTKDGQARNIYRSPPSLVGPYGEGDADLPLRVAPSIYNRLVQEGLLELWQMECDLIPMYVEMRYRGVRVDIEKAIQLRDKLKIRIVEEQKNLDAVAGMKVEVYEKDSLVKLFDKFQIPYPRTEPSKRHPKGQPSITKPYLLKLNHPIGNRVKQIKRLDKMMSVFLESYIINGNKKGFIHGSFHPLRSDDGGTIVGRDSSSHPNLQNLPIRDKEKLEDGSFEQLGVEIRSIFLPFEGHKDWIKFDYSQIQYRMLIHHAIGPGAEEARQRYRSNPETDYHAWVQEMVERIFNKKVERRPIKNLNFGVAFGMGDDKLMTDMQLSSRALAREFLEAYHKGVPFLKPTIKQISSDADLYGIICSLLGRRARFDLWEPRKWDGIEHPPLPYEQAVKEYGRVRRAYVHKALNRLLQMDEADIMKKAQWSCWVDGVFNYTGVPMLMVHDENDFSNPGNVDDGFEEVKYRMANTTKVSIPILVDEKRVANWGLAD